MREVYARPCVTVKAVSIDRISRCSDARDPARNRSESRSETRVDGTIRAYSSVRVTSIGTACTAFLVGHGLGRICPPETLLQGPDSIWTVPQNQRICQDAGRIESLVDHFHPGHTGRSRYDTSWTGSSNTVRCGEGRRIMKVFVSWSGERSRVAAAAVRDWL